METPEVFLGVVELIGFIFDKSGKRPDPTKVKALTDWPEPEQMADITSQLAFENFVKEFIPA